MQQYTGKEMSFARDAPGIGGPLMDLHSNGINVTFDSVEEVAGRQAYRLSVKLPSGSSYHLWIDVQTFLDIKYDREFVNKFGQSVMVPVFNRNYQTIGGLQIPLLIETGDGIAQIPDKMLIEKVLLNPPLEDSNFAKPNLPQRRNSVTVNATPAPDSAEVR
jgi:hypothetical protein